MLRNSIARVHVSGMLLMYAFCCLGSLGVHAEITLPQRAVIPHNGEYAITQDLGVTAGNNVFHSFHSFNLEQGETAAFSASPHIENVISRVTGGSASSINGTIKNTIPGADTYLLNPAGIIFGEHASLDVQGGFYATTADALEFSDGKFYVDEAQTSVFSAASVKAFGFLGDAAIRVGNTKLAVPAGETLSLAAGNIRIHGDMPIQMDATVSEPIDATSWLAAPGGEIRLQTPDDGLIDLERSLIDSSGAGGGLLQLGGGRLDMRESYLDATLWEAGREGLESGVHLDFKESIFARNLDNFRTVSLNSYGGDYPGSLRIDVPFLHLDEALFGAAQLSPGQTADYDIRAEHIVLENGAHLSLDAFAPGAMGNDLQVQADRLDMRGRFSGERVTHGLVLREYPSGIANAGFGGDGGNILITAGQIDMDDDAYFAVSSLGSGNGGYLRVIADDLSLRHASYLSSAAHGSGKAGNIEVTVTNTLLMKGRNDVPYSVPTALGDPTPPEVYTTGNNTIASFAYPESQGGGQITIRAGKLEMHDDAFIKATNYAQTGTAGHVSVTADTILLRSGAQIKNDNFQDTARVLVGEGDSGDLDITVGKIDIAGGGEVHAHSALSTDTYGPGRGGNINVTAEELVLHDGGAIISRSLGEGDAGHININSDSITLNNAGTISTEAANAGGGQIEMYADGLLRADNSQITTSVQNGAGNGGDLDIAAQFVVQDRAPITARAVEGDGGNIQIATKGIYQFGGASVNPIDASSKFGVSGEVELETPNKNLNESVFIVSGQFLRSTGISLEHCQHLNEQNVSRLRIRTETSDIGKLPGDFLE